MIKNITSLYYDGKDNGIILDGAYDLYKRNQYVKYVKENFINYLRCQDIDMNLLTFFPSIEFITIPEDAENIEGVYNLRVLRGLEITAKKLEFLDLSRFCCLEYLVIHDYSRESNLTLNCKQLKHLYIIHSNIIDLYSISINCDLESLHLEFCYSLNTLEGIQLLGRLNKLELDYCLKLKDVSDIRIFAKSMKQLIIRDCNRILGLVDVLLDLLELERLYISTFQTTRENKLLSIGFVEKLVKLKSFMTDYKIEDGNLKPLLNIEDVVILRFYKHYNLRKDFLK